MHAWQVLSAAHVVAWCIYPSDGNSRGVLCETPRGDAHCVPGCRQCAAGPGSDWGCAYPPSMLKQALERQQAEQRGATDRYNELVVDSRSIEVGLPHSIDAFFYVAGADQAVVQETARIRADFCREFGLRHARVPLVRYDGSPGAPHAFTLHASDEAAP